MANAPRLRRAAQYLRMSSDQQDYSIEYQTAAIAEFAADHGFDVMASYADEGVSGLGVEKRLGLKALMSDVFSGRSGFEAILVYDVSRWGRFQNPDQAAHYEFMCHEAGAQVIYCAEPFQNDASPLGALVKHVKRTMAAEYSRELSAKVRRGKYGLRALGYWQGSTPGYGLRREIVSRDGQTLAVRDRGEWKGFPAAHTRLTEGPPCEIETVRRIYEMFLKHDLSCREIAAALNREGVRCEAGSTWGRARIHGILTNPKYAGRLTVGRFKVTLGGARSAMPPAEWVVVPGASPEVVSARAFRAVQQKLRDRQSTEEDALADLRRLLREHGKLTARIVGRFGRWSTSVYHRRFGGLSAAFAAAGYTPGAEDAALLARFNLRRMGHRANPEEFKAELIAALKRALAEHGRLTTKIVNAHPETASVTTYCRWFGSLAAAYAMAGYVPQGRQKTLMQRHGSREDYGWALRSPQRVAPPAT